MISKKFNTELWTCFSIGNPFKNFIEYYCPCDFVYIAKYIDKYMIEAEEGQYKLEIPYNIDVRFEANKVELTISKYKEE